MLQAHTNSDLWLFNLFSVQIMMWTRDEFRLCHQEWTSPRWVIQNMFSHKSSLVQQIEKL